MEFRVYIRNMEEILMKKRIVTMMLALLIAISGIWSQGVSARAEDAGEDIDYSYLLTEDALIGYAEEQTWGVYLAEGFSSINKLSSTKIGAGGSTNAAVKCTVSITSIVERQTSTGWARVTSWTQTNESAYSAMISKSLTVATGYWYRVRSAHYAASDVSSSCTSSLYMGN